MEEVPAEQHGPPPAEAASAESWLKGHVGHLTAQEESSFEAFKKLAAKEGFYTPAADNKNASHDDGTLMYRVSIHILRSTYRSPAGTCELGSLSLKRRSSNSKTRRYGAETTI